MSGQQLRVAKKNKLSKILLSFGVIFVLLLIGVWIWSGSNGSLATALSLVQNKLPVQSITLQNAQASIRNGGHIGNIRIEQNDGSIISLDDVDVNWKFLGIFSKNLTVEHLSAKKIHFLPAVDSQDKEDSAVVNEPKTENGSKTGSAPPEEIGLPIQITINKLEVDRIVSGAQEQEVASKIDVSYRFDGVQHILDVQSAKVADGLYQGKATLTALQPVLDAHLSGVITTHVPQSNQSITLNAKVDIQGPLTLLNIKANAQTVHVTSDNGSTAVLDASVAPWATLKIPEANLELQAFNTNTFWAQSPQTLLSGTAKIVTSVENSSGQEKTSVALNIKNVLPGAIDQSKIPVSAVNGTVMMTGERVNFDGLTVHLNAGKVVITGHAILPQDDSTTFKWNADFQLTDVDPRLLYSTLATDRLSGTVKLMQDKAGSIRFDANITAANAKNMAQFQVKQIITNGTLLLQKQVSFNSLTVRALNAQVNGHHISYVLNSGAVSGPLTLTASGIEADATLSAFAQHSGSAKINVVVLDASKAAEWLRQQPLKVEPLVELLDKVSRYTKNLSAYTKAIPITVNDGWEKPKVNVEIDINALIANIIEQEGKNKLLESIVLPKPSQGEGGVKQEAEKEALRQIGNLFNRNRNK